MTRAYLRTVYLIEPLLPAANGCAPSKTSSPPDGYACLVWGLHRAEEMLEEGLPWAEELVGRWRLAVENYCTRCGAKME